MLRVMIDALGHKSYVCTLKLMGRARRISLVSKAMVNLWSSVRVAAKISLHVCGETHPINVGFNVSRNPDRYAD
jgi:hypothetical protein